MKISYRFLISTVENLAVTVKEISYRILIDTMKSVALTVNGNFISHFDRCICMIGTYVCLLPYYCHKGLSWWFYLFIGTQVIYRSRGHRIQGPHSIYRYVTVYHRS